MRALVGQRHQLAAKPDDYPVATEEANGQGVSPDL
jgi:hypothetical protein